MRSELLQRIEQTGLKAFIDYRDFTLGAPRSKECERGVAGRKTPLVLVPDYIASDWGEMESVIVQTLDPAKRELRLIPMLVQPGILCCFRSGRQVVRKCKSGQLSYL